MRSYVYKHMDGDTVVYVGAGRNDRAWSTKRFSKEHKEWMETKLPFLDVVFVAAGLDEKEAFQIEKDLIQRLQPKYNLKSTDRDLRRKAFGRWLADNYPKCHDPESQRKRGLAAAASPNNVNKQKRVCIHCNFISNPGTIARYHNDNCKQRAGSNETS